MSYARTSKQVDVRQLKETLWHQITEEQTGQVGATGKGGGWGQKGKEGDVKKV